MQSRLQFGSRGRLHLSRRQDYPQVGAGVSVHDDFRVALMGDGVLSDYCKTEAGAFNRARVFRVTLVEGFEYVGTILGGDSWTFVHYVDHGVRTAFT